MDSTSSSSSALAGIESKTASTSTNADSNQDDCSSTKPLFSSNSPYASLPIKPGQTKSSIKRAFKKEQWQAGKSDRRKREKDRKKEKKLAQKEANGVQDGGQDKIQNGKNGNQNQKKGNNKRKVEKNCTIVIDCGFDDLMTEQEITSMSSQLSYLYSVNRNSSAPFKSIIISGANLIRGGNYSKIKKKVKDSNRNEIEIETGEVSQPHESAIQEALESGSENLQRAEIESCGGWNDESNPKPQGFSDREIKPSGSSSGFGRDWNPSIFKGRVGKRMENQMKGDWRKWKRIQILEKGGLEALWETNGEESRDDEQELKKEGESVKEGEINEMEGIEGQKSEKSRGKRKENPKSKGRPQASWKCTEKFRKEDVIYLTADTDDTIEELEDGKVYVLGGIVDRNRHKELCSNKAKALGLKTARLPLDPKFLFNEAELKTRKVLTVNQVIEILVGFNEEKDWKLAIERGLPTRKLEVSSGKGGKRKRGLDGSEEGEEVEPAKKEEEEQIAEDI